MTSIVRLQLITTACFCFLSSTNIIAEADVAIENFTLTPNSLSFDIRGTFPAATPFRGSEVLFFVNPDSNESPGFALGSFINSSFSSFSGTQSLRPRIEINGAEPIATGGDNFGDYFYVAFSDRFQPNETIDGTVEATWPIDAFDTDVTASLNAFWGFSGRLSVTDGVPLGTVSIVPEPTTSWMFAIAALSLAIAHRRTRSGWSVQR
ncbi:MAG: PEP-CTERM sorting domain-containing protein [Planctomycetota bacterium]